MVVGLSGKITRRCSAEEDDADDEGVVYDAVVTAGDGDAVEKELIVDDDRLLLFR